MSQHSYPSPASPTALRPNPLLDLHHQAGAEMQSYGELEIVSTFGEPEAEYAAIHKAAALIDEPQRGILEVTGRDRLSFLNNLLTNETWNKSTKNGLSPGFGTYAFFLNTKGRIVCDASVLSLEDRVLVELDARLVESTRTAFDKYAFTEQVKLTSRVGGLHQLALHGPGAMAIVKGSAEAGRGDEPLAALQCRQVKLFDVECVVWGDDQTGPGGCHLIVPSGSARQVWMNLVARFSSGEEIGKRRLRPIGWAAFNAARIEAGRPLFGIDFDDTVLPAETGPLLKRAVSFTKGCYLGQEIVARMHARGQVARQIVGIKMESDALPLAGAQCFAPDESGSQIGGITSSTISPILSGAAICLGYVRKAYIAPGSVVRVPAEGEMRQGTVVTLPFVT